jgi:hypothetical protein
MIAASAAQVPIAWLCIERTHTDLARILSVLYALGLYN